MDATLDCLHSYWRWSQAVGAATVVGLTDHDINVLDDQSVVITDYYSEQSKNTSNSFLQPCMINALTKLPGDFSQDGSSDYVR
jgi:hypothetical protein